MPQTLENAGNYQPSLGTSMVFPVCSNPTVESSDAESFLKKNSQNPRMS